MLVAIDTATRIASLALHDGDRVRYEITWEAGWRHTTEVAPRLVAALQDLGLKSTSLTGVAVTRGPGSFTGLRVGLALAKGLVAARGIPLVAVPTLDVLAAAQVRDRRPLLAVLQAGRGRICVAVYRWHDGWQLYRNPYLTTWQQLAETIERPTLVCGEIDEKGARVLHRPDGPVTIVPAAFSLRRAGFLAQLAWGRIHLGETDDPVSVAPIYLQQPV